MAFLDKAKALANQAMEKGEDAISTGKLMLKIKDEEKNIKEAEVQIGKLIEEKLDDGEQFEDRIMAYYEKIKDSRKRIADYKEEQAKIGEE